MDQRRLREIVEKAAASAVQAQAEQLQRAVIERVVAELCSAQAPGTTPTDLLNAAIASIQDSTSQMDILTALLNGAEKFSARTGLIVVRGSTGSGWQSRGLNGEIFKRTQLDCTRGLAERAIRTRLPVAGSAAEFDGVFAAQVGAPADGNVVLLPLVVKDRVAALLYADGGAEGSSGRDNSALEVLIRTTSLWLEVLSSRRSAGEQTAAAATTGFSHPAHNGGFGNGIGLPPVAPPVAQPSHTSSFGQPAFGHAPVASEAHAPTTSSSSYSPSAAAPAPAEDEIHNKARRFAKLLVEEIKLYNQTKVAEGRQNHDLYERLKEDIEKSRAAYQKRFGEVVQDVDYFSSELVRILADNDRALMGASFA